MKQITFGEAILRRMPISLIYNAGSRSGDIRTVVVTSVNRPNNQFYGEKPTHLTVYEPDLAGKREFSSYIIDNIQPVAVELDGQHIFSAVLALQNLKGRSRNALVFWHFLGDKPSSSTWIRDLPFSLPLRIHYTPINKNPK